MKMFKKLLAGKLEKTTNELFEIQAQKKEVEVEKQYLEATLKAERTKREMDMEVLEHMSRLALSDASARFSREKAEWEEDRLRLKKELDEDKARQSLILKEEHDRKLNEAISLCTLDTAQRIKQAEMDFRRQIQELKEKHAEELQQLKTKVSQEKMDLQTKLLQENYDKLNTALVELHSKGTATTQFVQELALKMLEKPMGATVTENRVLIGRGQDKAGMSTND